MSSIAPIIPDIVAATPNTSSSQQSAGADFSSLFNQALAQTLTGSALSGMDSGAAALPPLDDSFGLLQTSLLSSTAEGQTDSQSMLLYMLMMMMQEFKGSDLTPLITAFSGLTSNGKGVVRPSKLGYSGSSSAGFLPDQAWLPTSFKYSSNAGQRSAAALKQVIGQFNVESAERYRPGKNGNTYCNIFVWDVTRALSCEIPHYVDRASGQARFYPNTAGAYELDANGVCDWLGKNGAAQGWREVTAAEAQQYANAGYPAVTTWKNAGGGAGHVQVVCPSANGGYDYNRGVTVAQAGSRNFAYAHLNATMSADKRAQARYYVHE